MRPILKRRTGYKLRAEYVRWTAQEDAALISLARQLIKPGQDWLSERWGEAAALALPGRVPGACRARYELLWRQTPLEERKERFGNKPEPRIRGGSDHGYVLKVPVGDPLLKRLKANHGADNIDRDQRLPFRNA